MIMDIGIAESIEEVGEEIEKVRELLRAIIEA